MTGLGSRFSKTGITRHKGLLPFADDKTIVRNIVDILPSFDNYFIAVDRTNTSLHEALLQEFSSFNKKVHSCFFTNSYEGQAHSAFYAIQSIQSSFPEIIDLPIYIAPCDSLIMYDPSSLLNSLQTSFCSYTYRDLKFTCTTFFLQLCSSNKSKP